MKGCTVVTVPYEGSDGSVGAITIFGPKRMEYSKVIPLLEYIAGNIKKIVQEIKMANEHNRYREEENELNEEVAQNEETPM